MEADFADYSNKICVSPRLSAAKKYEDQNFYNRNFNLFIVCVGFSSNNETALCSRAGFENDVAEVFNSARFY